MNTNFFENMNKALCPEIYQLISLVIIKLALFTKFHSKHTRNYLNPQSKLSELKVNCISEIQSTTFAFQLTNLANSIKIAKSLRPKFWNHTKY